MPLAIAKLLYVVCKLASHDKLCSSRHSRQTHCVIHFLQLFFCDFGCVMAEKRHHPPSGLDIKYSSVYSSIHTKLDRPAVPGCSTLIEQSLFGGEVWQMVCSSSGSDRVLFFLNENVLQRLNILSNSSKLFCKLDSIFKQAGNTGLFTTRLSVQPSFRKIVEKYSQ